MRNDKRVVFVSRSEAEAMAPPAGTHLLSISDNESNQAHINASLWDIVSFHHFIDAGYDEDLIAACGESFEAIYRSYLLPDQAQTIRARICEIAEHAGQIVVNCEAGRSRSAAVARYISDWHGFVLEEATPDANMTVYRLLIRDPSLSLACRQAMDAAREAPTPRSVWSRLCDRFGLVKLDRRSLFNGINL